MEHFAIDCRDDGDCVLEYLPEPVGDVPGWPVVVSGPCRGTAKRADGRAYAACDANDGVLVHAFDADGAAISGWPVTLPGVTASVYDNLFTIGCGTSRSSLTIAGDGTLVVAIVAEAEAALHRLTAAGTVVPGWPQPFPGDPPGMDGIGGNGCRGFTLGADGAAVAWGYVGVEQEIGLVAARTEFVVYEPDGRTRSGWPREADGAASRPVVAGDGSIAYTSANGQVWLHLANGDVAPDSPYALDQPTAPDLAMDGRVVLFEETRAIALTRTGAVAPGWPVALGGRLETRCLFGDVPCSGSVRPAFGPDGTVYVSLADGVLSAIDAGGNVVPGWPVRLVGRAHAFELAVDDQGRLVVGAVWCGASGCESQANHMTLVYDGNGDVLEERPGPVFDSTTPSLPPGS